MDSSAAVVSMRNAGKSSLVNAVTGQALSLILHVKSTKNDPAKKRWSFCRLARWRSLIRPDLAVFPDVAKLLEE